MRRMWFSMGLVLFLSVSSALPAEKQSPEQAKETIKKATLFFKSIATNGGYVGLYSTDLKQRYGEAIYEKASADEIWVQPPGTPTVGECYLRAYKATDEIMYLDCARAAGLALAWGQRKEGGWDHRVDVSHLIQASPPIRKSGRCSFDDDISQGALTFLIRLDVVIDERWLTDSINLAIEFLKEAQFDNGAWPQWYPLIGGYSDYYTFNDNAINDCIRVMLFAHERYGREDCLKSAKLGGDFIIASQLPAPQSGWAQQYSHDMKPAWARAFEPPGVGSAETGQQIRTLIDIYLYTGEKKYLEPIPKAIDWLNRSKVTDNTWSRLNEVGTNRPIYGDVDSKVHYTLGEISEERRTGYSWQSGFGIPGAIQEYRDLMEQGIDRFRANRSKPLTTAEKKKRLEDLAPRTAAAIGALDERGRWIEKGAGKNTGMISCISFVRNMNILIWYIELVKETQ
ncbi:MAG: pectate lyase [Candidatus Latescibacter sp.]|nr:pectate lyase [Candidatus Latescibacter sp.]